MFKLFRHIFTKPVKKRNLLIKLNTFTSLIEQNLEYTLNLLSDIETSSFVHKTKYGPFKTGELANLKSEIKAGIVIFPADEIIRISTFIAVMENINNSAEEIKSYINELLKYPPIGFDFSEIAVKVSGIVKKSIDGFLSGNAAAEMKDEILDAETALNGALRRINELNEKDGTEKWRIVYYAGIVTVLNGIIKIFSNIAGLGFI